MKYRSSDEVTIATVDWDLITCPKSYCIILTLAFHLSLCSLLPFISSSYTSTSSEGASCHVNRCWDWERLLHTGAFVLRGLGGPDMLTQISISLDGENSIQKHLFGKICFSTKFWGSTTCILKAIPECTVPSSEKEKKNQRWWILNLFHATL